MDSSRSAVQTRDSIVSAMYSLLTQLDFESITIADICREAGVSRSTFYNHFEDKYALVVSSTIQDIRDAFTVDIADAKALQAGYAALMDRVLLRGSALKSLVHHETIYELQVKLDDAFLCHFEALYQMKIEQGYHFEKSPRMMAIYNSKGVAGTIFWWIAQDYPIEREALIAYLVEKTLQAMDFCVCGENGLP